MEIGNELLEFRAKHNLTQLALSLIIGVSVGMISQYETGHKSPTAKNKILFRNKMNEWEEKRNGKK
jgi:transcriptional regulator with XRE-family HTH domain